MTVTLTWEAAVGIVVIFGAMFGALARYTHSVVHTALVEFENRLLERLNGGRYVKPPECAIRHQEIDRRLDVLESKA